MAITKERTEEIVIGDLQEAQHLFERDSSYLKIIGEHYGADISGRGNMIRIKGEEEAVENSLHVIARIRHMIASRIRLSERQVRLVMSLIDQGKGNLLQEMEDDIINFTKNGARSAQERWGRSSIWTRSAGTPSRSASGLQVRARRTSPWHWLLLLFGIMTCRGSSSCVRQSKQGRNLVSFRAICRKRSIPTCVRSLTA